MSVEEENVPSSIIIRLQSANSSSMPPIASPFLQAQLKGSDQYDDEEEMDKTPEPLKLGQYIDTKKVNELQLIASNTPSNRSEASDDIDFNPSNLETAHVSMQQIVESQKQLIDQFRIKNEMLSKQLTERQINHTKTLQNTINKNEIEMNELRIEIERLNEENRKISQLQAVNIELKQKLAKFDKIINAKRSKALPTLPTLTNRPMAGGEINKSSNINKIRTDTINGGGGIETEDKPKEVMFGTRKQTQISKKRDSKTIDSKNRDSQKRNSKIIQSKTNEKLIKYEKMKKIEKKTKKGQAFESIMNRMRMDQCSDDMALIDIDINDIKFEKYKVMKKINMPFASIINRMRMDGLSNNDIDIFEGKRINKILIKKENNYKIKQNELAIEMGVKPKLDITPKRVQRLKRIHWKVIQLKDIKGTIWEKFAKKYSDQEIGIDTKFELQFQIRPRKPQKFVIRRNRIIDNLSFKQNKKHNKKKQIIKWLSCKRDEMIQIGLKKIGLTHCEIYNGISEMNENVITMDILERLYDLLPSETEQILTDSKIEEIISSDNINNSEMFFIEISRIPLIRQQISKWLFVRSFGEIYSDRIQQITKIIRCMQLIRNNRSLHLYLRIILAIGNLMNHGTDKSMAYGFNLKCLNMLQGIKDFSGKKSLAMFLYEFAFNKFPITQKLDIELKLILHSAVRLEINIIEKSVKSMSDKFDDIHIFERKLADNYHETETIKFGKYMKEFRNKNKSKMAVIKTKLKNAKIISRSVAKYYGYFDLTEENKPEKLIFIIYEFIESMNKAKRSLFELEKERLKKREKLIAEKKEIKKRNMINNNNDDLELLEESPLRSHFRKQTENFHKQQFNMKEKLNTTFHEKQCIAKGQIIESLKKNHIKQQSIMGSIEIINNMDDIAKLINKELKHKKKKKRKNKKKRHSKKYKINNNGNNSQNNTLLFVPPPPST